MKGDFVMIRITKTKFGKFLVITSTSGIEYLPFGSFHILQKDNGDVRITGQHYFFNITGDTAKDLIKVL